MSMTLSIVISGRKDTGVFVGATCLVDAVAIGVVVCCASAYIEHDKNRAINPVFCKLQ
jgi:hypothetical protein